MKIKRISCYRDFANMLKTFPIGRWTYKIQVWGDGWRRDEVYSFNDDEIFLIRKQSGKAEVFLIETKKR